MIMKGHAVFALLSQSPPAGSVSVPTDYRQPAVAWDAARWATRMRLASRMTVSSAVTIGSQPFDRDKCSTEAT